MIFLSKLLNTAVRDVGGCRLGHLGDLLVDPREVFPRVVALAISVPGHSMRAFGGETVLVPWECIADLEAGEITLNVTRDTVVPYVLQPGDVYLRRDILDKQIVDAEGRRIVKVNDLKLAEIDGVGRLVGMDISLRGFLRRLGVERTADLLDRLLPIDLLERLITWNYVELPEERSSVRLTVSYAQLGELHPADLADIVELTAPAQPDPDLPSRGLPDRDRRPAAGVPQPVHHAAA